jgi:hypothetical protein
VRRRPSCSARLVPLLLAAFGMALGAGPARAVIIASGDGTGNTTAPSPDPGWSYLGTRGGLTVVYLGDGWVLTANHVGAGSVVLGGVSYPNLPGTELRLDNGDGTLADLLLFAIYPYPALPPLPIATGTPAYGESLILAGNGHDRGQATSWDPNGPPPPGPYLGFDWASTHSMRWGTNHSEGGAGSRVLGTEAFYTSFDAGGSPDECQAAAGDSGGAAFVETGSQWELAGILYAIGQYDGQPAQTALYGNDTYAADLSFYRDQILAVTSLPEPDARPCLLGGAVLLGVAGRRRMGRARARALQQG